jgi:hypothetical protein
MGALSAAELRSRQGTALVTAVARDHGATIITSNIKDYPMEDVTVLSLR